MKKFFAIIALAVIVPASVPSEVFANTPDAPPRQCITYYVYGKAWTLCI
jgi:hypothetical protein